MEDYIDNGENLKIKPIDLSIKNKQTNSFFLQYYLFLAMYILKQ